MKDEKVRVKVSEILGGRNARDLSTEDLLYLSAIGMIAEAEVKSRQRKGEANGPS